MLTSMEILFVAAAFFAGLCVAGGAQGIWLLGHAAKRQRREEQKGLDEEDEGRVMVSPSGRNVVLYFDEAVAGDFFVVRANEDDAGTDEEIDELEKLYAGSPSFEDAD